MDRAFRLGCDQESRFKGVKLSVVAVPLDRRDIEQGSGLPAGVAADVQPVITDNSVGQQSVYALLGFRFNTWGFRPMAFFKPELGVIRMQGSTASF